VLPAGVDTKTPSETNFFHAGFDFIYPEDRSVGIISIGDVLKIMIKEQKELIDHLQKFITS
jgi:hypothetical protein